MSKPCGFSRVSGEILTGGSGARHPEDCGTRDVAQGSIMNIGETCLIRLKKTWFQKFVFLPLLGGMIQFDLRIFFNWVGSTTN